MTSSLSCRRPRSPVTRRNYTYNLRLIRRTMPYSIQEVADLYHLHPNAVRRWLKDGLKVTEKVRPYLIYGGDLIDFLGNRQRRRKRPSEAGQMYCCRCRASRRPAAQSVSIELLNLRQLIVRGRCELCETRMQTFGASTRVDELAAEFAATAPATLLVDTADAAVPCHFSHGVNGDHLQPEK